MKPFNRGSGINFFSIVFLYMQTFFFLFAPLSQSIVFVIDGSDPWHRFVQIRDVGDYVVGLQELVQTLVAGVHSYLTK